MHGRAQRRTPIKTQAKSDGLRLLRAIDETQAHGKERVRADPFSKRAAHEAVLDVGDVVSDCYHYPLGYLRDTIALAGYEHTATRMDAGQHQGYELYFFARRAATLLGG